MKCIKGKIPIPNENGIASCTACKNVCMVVEHAILIRYYSHTPKARALIGSMNGPTAWPADNPPNSDRLGVYHPTVPELTVQVYWQPGPPIWQRLGLDPDPDPKWWSGTSANTCMDEVGHQEVGHNAGNMLKQLNPRWTWHNESLASATLVLASLSILYKLWSHRGCCSWGGT